MAVLRHIGAERAALAFLNVKHCVCPKLILSLPVKNANLVAYLLGTFEFVRVFGSDSPKSVGERLQLVSC